MKLVECVPNFSEGRDRKIIDQITAVIGQVPGATLLDVDPGADTNRTVVTFVAPPEAAVEAAFCAIRRASELIDMSQHKGAHARMGATDVCPFVPVSEVTMEDCAELARRLGERVGRELKIPIFLYEKAASRPERENLAEVRKGEYEGLADKFKDPQWAPDYGPAEFNVRSGATAVGAREFLIAYNINLNTKKKKLAHDIALTIREQGRVKRDENNKMVRDEEGNKVMVPGLFPSVKAVGWVIEEYNCAQISMNLTDYNKAAPHEVFDRVCELAWEKGMRVTGSELVGLIPKKAMIDAGQYYLRKQGLNAGLSDDALIATAVQSMGLNEIAPFDSKEKVIEYAIRDDDSSLMSKTGHGFVEILSSDAPAPGGGSVAALAGSFSAALAAMVAALTHGKKGYLEVNQEMESVGIEGHRYRDILLDAVDTDARSFDGVMEAMRLPRKSDEDKAARLAAIQEANKTATLVPLETLKNTIRPLELALVVADRGNQNSLSDAGVAGLMGRAAAEGAYYNVVINLSSVEDMEFREQTKKQADALLEQANQVAQQVQELVMSRLNKSLE